MIKTEDFLLILMIVSTESLKSGDIWSTFQTELHEIYFSLINRRSSFENSQWQYMTVSVGICEEYTAKDTVQEINAYNTA